jgi:hypothetical protein
VTHCPDGVLYVPAAKTADYWPSKALVITRYSVCPHAWGAPTPPRIVIRATDLCCDAYGHHQTMLKTSRAALIAVTTWHADMFSYAQERVVIPPMLGPAPADVTKVPRRFVYGSGPVKGLSATVKKWLEMREKYSELNTAELLLMSPGWGDWPAEPAYNEKTGIRFIGNPTPAEYQRIVASAEGLFFVNTFTETFCCLAALAERDKTRTHILCKAGFGGIPEALVNHTLLTDDEGQFERNFIEALHDPTNPKWYAEKVIDRSAKALVASWEKALSL